ncbi:CGI-144-like protein, partial [Piptocephalis cylindrospora]
EREKDPAEESASEWREKATVHKTDAEQRFEERQKARLMNKVVKIAEKSHKEKVQEFNERLEKMSEHYDIPKV